MKRQGILGLDRRGGMSIGISGFESARKYSDRPRQLNRQLNRRYPSLSIVAQASCLCHICG